MEKFNSGQNRKETVRYLPEGYSANDLKQMDKDELIAICEKQGLDYVSVLNLLEKTTTVEPNVPPTIPLAERKLHPDYQFINHIREISKNGQLDMERRVQFNFNNIQRDPSAIESSEIEAHELLKGLDDIEDWKKRGDTSERITQLFKTHYLQKGLQVYDNHLRSTGLGFVSEAIAQRHAFALLSQEYNYRDNIYQRQRGLKEALAYFGADVNSMKEVLYELNQMLTSYENGTATQEERNSLNRLMRAIKAAYFGADTNIDAGVYNVLIPSLADEYRKKVDPKRLRAATLQGGAIYDIGEYFGNSYVKNPRPRRYDDGLGHGG